MKKPKSRKGNEKRKTGTRKTGTRKTGKIGTRKNGGYAGKEEIELNEIYAAKDNAAGNERVTKSVFQLYIKPPSDVIMHYIDGINDYLKTIVGIDGKFKKDTIYSNNTKFTIM